MIQARWHKNARIRKKWLKRYGMKPDLMKVEFHDVNIQFDGYEANWETTQYYYKFRPDQMRRGIKIEF